MSDERDYSQSVRAELARLLENTPPGKWGLLALCPGPFGCPHGAPDEAPAPDDEDEPWPCCRVIRVYRARRTEV